MRSELLPDVWERFDNGGCGMKTVIPYTPIKGWFDLSKLNLPKDKFKRYSELQRLGKHYQDTYQYQKLNNRIQLEKLKELCAIM